MNGLKSAPKYAVGDEVLTVSPDLPHLNFQATRIQDVIQKEDGFYYMTVLQIEGQPWPERKFLRLPKDKASANDG
jgi:hypothetical protein